MKESELLSHGSLTVIESAFEWLEDLPNKPLTDDTLAKSRIAAGKALLKVLPNYVARIDVGEGVLVLRESDELKSVPEDKRVSWDLARVDQTAATSARVLNLDWTSRFPS